MRIRATVWSILIIGVPGSFRTVVSAGWVLGRAQAHRTTHRDIKTSSPSPFSWIDSRFVREIHVRSWVCVHCGRAFTPWFVGRSVGGVRLCDRYRRQCRLPLWSSRQGDSWIPTDREGSTEDDQEGAACRDLHRPDIQCTCVCVSVCLCSRWSVVYCPWDVDRCRGACHVRVSWRC